ARKTGADKKPFSHANPRHDLRQWSVILLAASFIAYFAPSVAGSEAQAKEAMLLASVGISGWAIASYLRLPKFTK
ncbi:MAG: hypothetical protein OD817_05735, partial [Gammaproteobacteria bacterium]